MILHATLDMIDDAKWQSGTPYLKSLDSFDDSHVSVYLTPGHVKLLTLSDVSLGDEPLRHFFAGVHDLYVKEQLSPFHRRDIPITSVGFTQRVEQLARKHLAR